MSIPNPFNEIALKLDCILGVLSDLEKDQLDKTIHNRYLTGKEVEEAFSITAATRYEWHKSGLLKPYKIGSRTRYLKSDIDNLPREVESTTY